MVELCKKIAEDRRFQLVIMGLIVLNAILLGLETDEGIKAQWGLLIDIVEYAIMSIFVVEIGIRLVASSDDLRKFFTNGWDVFDLVVVVVSLIPQIGPLGTVVRLVRVLRVARLVAFSKELRLVFETLIRSIPSLGHVALLLALLLYIYGVMGTMLFSDIEYEGSVRYRFGSLAQSVWTMFHTLTFENWVAVSDPVTNKYPAAWLFFTSFIMLAVFVGVNMFVAIVMNNLDEVKAEQKAEPHEHDGYNDVVDQVEKLKATLAELEATIVGLKEHLQKPH